MQVSGAARWIYYELILYDYLIRYKKRFIVKKNIFK